jgi:hypothetical protein
VAKPTTTKSGKLKAGSFRVVKDLPDIYLPAAPGTKGSAVWKEWAKESFLTCIRAGLNIADSCAYLGVSRGWYEKNVSRDPDFKSAVRRAREGEDAMQPGDPLVDFSKMSYRQFSHEYLGWDVYDHQEPIIQALEDGQINKTIVTGFPESGKSTHVTLGYLLYRICQNVDIRVALISKSQTKAEDLLRRLKRYMTEEHLYDHTPRNLIHDMGGFKPDPHSAHRWDQEQITIRQRRSGERDATVQALGVGAQIYGARIDLLILDDALTLENQLTPERRAKIDSWFIQEAASRAHKGEVIIVGTRVHPEDNFKQWLIAWEDDPHAAFVKIPAIVIRDGVECSTWPEYWPLEGKEIWDEVSQRDIYQKGMLDIRKEMEGLGAWRWRLVYQQEDVGLDSSIFSTEAIDRALDLGRNRSIGQVFPHEILILGIDPATTGRAAAILYAYDPKSRVRTVVDIFVGDTLGATGVREKLMYQFWERYHPQRTLIEVNYAPTIMGDEVLRTRAQAAGTLLLPHKTLGKGRKRGSVHDEEYGVAAMAPLLNGGLLALPSATPDDRRILSPLLEDLAAYPYGDQKDAVMALWIAEGEIPFVAVETPDTEDVIAGRNLPPRIARRLRGRRSTR